MATVNPFTILYGAKEILRSLEEDLKKMSAAEVAQRLDRVFIHLVFHRPEFNGWWAPPGTFESFARDYERVANKIYRKISYIDTLHFAMLPKIAKKVDKADGKILKIPYLYSLTTEAIEKIKRLGELKGHKEPDLSCPPPYLREPPTPAAFPCPPPSL